MAILDDFKLVLARTNPASTLKVQYGETGSTFLISAAVLQEALHVKPNPRVRLRVTSAQLNLRDRPTTAGMILARFVKDAIIEIDPTTSTQADGFRWAQLYDGRGYVALDFATATPVETPVANFEAPDWVLPMIASQRGICLDAGGWAPGVDSLTLIPQNRIEFALICAYQRGQAAETIPVLRALGVKNFILRAAISEPVTTPQRYADLAIPILQEYVAAMGTTAANQLLIALHNEPNTAQEGLGRAWADGKTFGAWFDTLRDMMRYAFPNARLGFPALSPIDPQNTTSQPENAFLAGCTASVAKADWVGVHYYWQQFGGQDIAIPATKWRQQFGPKHIIATEVGPADNNRIDAASMRRAYAAFEAAGIPACGWVLSGAGAWQNASWVLNKVVL